MRVSSHVFLFFVLALAGPPKFATHLPFRVAGDRAGDECIAALCISLRGCPVLHHIEPSELRAFVVASRSWRQGTFGTLSVSSHVFFVFCPCSCWPPKFVAHLPCRVAGQRSATSALWHCAYLRGLVLGGCEQVSDTMVHDKPPDTNRVGETMRMVNFKFKIWGVVVHHHLYMSLHGCEQVPRRRPS